MIYSLTKFKVCDNSGVKDVKCFKVGSKPLRNKDPIGCLVLGVVKSVKFGCKHKKGDKLRGVIVRSKKTISRDITGIFLSFEINEIILIGVKDDVPLGTRIFGPLPKELRKKGFLRILSLGSDTI